MIYPFENDTSIVERKIADRSLAANKRRNCLAGIIIFFASFLLSFMMILLCNATIYGKMIRGINNSYEVVNSVVGISVLLLFTAGLAVKNIFYVSVLQRTREFAQLRTVGATDRQIASVVSNERKMLTRKFLAFGLFVGFGGNIVLPIEFYILPSIACVFFSGAFIWLLVFFAFRTPVKMAISVSPMDALKQINIIHAQPYKKYNRITPNSLGIRYFLSNRKKAYNTLFSLVLSGVLMFIVFTVMYAINVEEFARQSYQENSDLYIQLNSSLEYPASDLMKNSPLTSALHQEISSMLGVESIYRLKMLDCNIFNDDNGDNISLAVESIINEASLKSIISEGEAPVYNEGFNTIPVVVNRASYYYENSGLILNIGDIVQATIGTGYSNQIMQFEICGFIENKDAGTVLYTNSEYFDNISEMNCDLVWYICTEQKHTKSIVSAIQSLVLQDNRLRMSVLEEDILLYKTIFHNVTVVISILTIVVSLFAFVNLLNTCITNTIVRNYDYALLEAVGMTIAQISDMQSIEHFIYFIGSFIGSCVLGIPSGIVICNKIAQISGVYYVRYRFPFGFVILYGIFILVTFNIAMAYQKRLFARHSVVERIRSIYY